MLKNMITILFKEKNMKYNKNIYEAIFKSRPNRFNANVILNGE